jgi:NAD(P)-dependent dehydrogenase (short-subunit alcohol dehydrogenase family)
MQALKRIGQPEDVGSVVAFLASQDANWLAQAIHTGMFMSSCVPNRAIINYMTVTK